MKFKGHSKMSNKTILKQLDLFREAIVKNEVLANKTKQNYLYTLKSIVNLFKNKKIKKIDKDSFASLKKLIGNRDHTYNALLNKFVNFIETGEVKFGSNIPFKKVFAYKGMIGKMHKAFTSQIASELSNSTIHNHLKNIDSFCSYCEAQSVKKLSYEVVINFIHYSSFKNQNDAYFKLSSIRYFVKKLFKLDLINTDFSLKIRVPKLIRRKPKIRKYTSKEIEIIMKSIPRESKNFYRDSLIAVLLVKYGLRPVDIAKLKFESIQRASKEIFIIQSKTKKSLTLPLLDEVNNAIEKYCEFERPKDNYPYIISYRRKPGEYMEPKTIGTIIEKILKNSGIDLSGRHCSPKSFRSSLAMELTDKGVPSSSIRQILGHSNTYSLGHYTKLERSHLLKCVVSVSLIKSSFYNRNIS